MSLRDNFFQFGIRNRLKEINLIFLLEVTEHLHRWRKRSRSTTVIWATGSLLLLPFHRFLFLRLLNRLFLHLAFLDEAYRMVIWLWVLRWHHRDLSGPNQIRTTDLRYCSINILLLCNKSPWLQLWCLLLQLIESIALVIKKRNGGICLQNGLASVVEGVVFFLYSSWAVILFYFYFSVAYFIHWSSRRLLEILREATQSWACFFCQLLIIGL